MRNYLLRLGWAHGDDEIISTEQAIAWFDLDGVGRSPARFDFAKLDNLNGHYIARGRRRAPRRPRAAADRQAAGRGCRQRGRGTAAAGMEGLKPRAKTLVELADSALFYVRPRPLPVEDKAAKLLHAGGARPSRGAGDPARAEADWTAAGLEAAGPQLRRGARA